MRKISFLIAICCAAASLSAQQVRPASSDKIYRQLKQMQHLANVLYVAAHPDDENTRLLAWLVNDRYINTAYLSLTRGDGGQNILGSEQSEALGLIRTHELMEARKLDGAGQYFCRAIDFGFSKTHEETFKHWPTNELTGDAVWVIRQFRPDVVICRFPPNTMAGHGQHAASAVIAENAWNDAGDASKYPEQLKYVATWKPKRLLLNTYKFGDRNTTSEDQFKLKVGHYVPGMGMGIGELAGQSRSIHKSQGAGTPSVPGVQTEYFKLVAGDSLSQSLFDGIDITWSRIGRKDIGNDLKAIVNAFDFLHPDYSLPSLLNLRRKIVTVSDNYWRTQKLAELDKTILDCSGFMAELCTKQPQATSGEQLAFTLKVIARSHTPVRLQRIYWGGNDTLVGKQLPIDSLWTIEHTMSLPSNAALTQPYWLQSAHGGKWAMYPLPHDTLLGMPETPNKLVANLQLQIGTETLDVPVPLSYKKLDPVRGDVVEQLRIVPDISVAFTAPLIIAAGAGPIYAELNLHAYRPINAAQLTLTGPLGQTKILNGINLSKGRDTLIRVDIASIAAPKSKTSSREVTATVTAIKNYNLSHHLIQYSHLPALQYFTEAKAKLVRPDWKCTAKRIGFVAGAGDYLPDLLRLAGLQVETIKEADLLQASKLKKYDAIVTGIRAVNVEKKMATWMPVLLDYTKNGGTLVMQYNTTQDMATNSMGPYPFTISSSERVTEEDALITVVDANHKLLNHPNKITQADFAGWVQERGLYFPTKWDSSYQTLFSMNDAGEQPKKGGTLYTHYGKGHYLYTCLSFSRQLPAGNEGAIRLLLNFISAGK